VDWETVVWTGSSAGTTPKAIPQGLSHLPPKRAGLVCPYSFQMSWS